MTPITVDTLDHLTRLRSKGDEVFYMSMDVYREARRAKFSDGSYAWVFNPAPDGKSSIMGYPVNVLDDCTGHLSFGDAKLIIGDTRIPKIQDRQRGGRLSICNL